MLNNKKYLNLQTDFEEQRKKIALEEFLMLKDWHNHLNNFFNNSDGYILVESGIYVKFENILSGVMPTDGISKHNNYPLHWYRLKGIAMNVSGNTIDECFQRYYDVKLDNKEIKYCSKQEFEDNFKKICERIFSEENDNFEFQYKKYTSKFYENILYQYEDMFPDYVFDFVIRLEERLDTDLQYENENF